MAYFLRHEPEGMDMDREGFVPLNDLIEKLRGRGLNVNQHGLKSKVRDDTKGRYEIRGDKIRARYGHSINVNPTLQGKNIPNILYHGTSPEAGEKILKSALKSRGRQKVHLSGTIAAAKEVGRRHCSNPVILTIDCREAAKKGIEIQKAGKEVYVADHIPPDMIELLYD